MAFKKFVRTRIINRQDPTVTLDAHHFRFNPVASRLAKLSSNSEVIYYIDEENRKIGFEFSNESDDRSAYSVFPEGGKSSYRSAINEICARYSWVRAVAQLPDPRDRTFKLKTESNRLWVIQLCPAFEYSVAMASDVPSSVEGIYRYLDSEDNVIYIGKGNVRRRSGNPERNSWGIFKIEYSIVQGDKDQYEWEDYWLEKYKEEHDGALPPFNRVSGHSQG